MLIQKFPSLSLSLSFFLSLDLVHPPTTINTTTTPHHPPPSYHRY
ncbi:hypothetical protein HanRHA438_Chr08g0361321 [Helianthus annuus]|nr:hypothetical protein HanRHA438_Chr08g0361321 [Helianthus annuus]